MIILVPTSMRLCADFFQKSCAATCSTANQQPHHIQQELTHGEASWWLDVDFTMSGPGGGSDPRIWSCICQTSLKDIKGHHAGEINLRQMSGNSWRISTSHTLMVIVGRLVIEWPLSTETMWFVVLVVSSAIWISSLGNGFKTTFSQQFPTDNDWQMEDFCAAKHANSVGCRKYRCAHCSSSFVLWIFRSFTAINSHCSVLTLCWM